MAEDKHINIDLEFLDKDEPIHAKTSSSPTGNPSPSKPSKYNWKGILVVSAIVLVIAISAATEDDTSNTNTPSSSTSVNSQSDSVVVGRYTCSSYNKSQADSLNPTDAESRQLDNETQSLKDRVAAIQVSSDRIDNMAVDNTDQDSLDYYNQQVNIHNAKFDTYKRDAAAHELKITDYNVRVEKYNNYLDAHCTRDY